MARGLCAPALWKPKDAVGTKRAPRPKSLPRKASRITERLFHFGNALAERSANQPNSLPLRSILAFVDLYRLLPAEGVKIVLVLFLSFLIGLEREEHKSSGVHYTFGGVRTFPLIGLIGYSIALLSGAQLLPVTLGFLVVGGFLLLSYWHKISRSESAGVPSEMSGITTYLVGALVYYDHFWIATALSVTSLLLLELKTGLENLTKRIAPEEIFTFTKFLLLSAVILPILPNSEFGSFR